MVSGRPVWAGPLNHVVGRRQLPLPPLPMHEGNGRQQVERVPARLNPEAPEPRRRTDQADEFSTLADSARQMLPPIEWGVEHPDLAISYP